MDLPFEMIPHRSTLVNFCWFDISGFWLWSFSPPFHLFCICKIFMACLNSRLCLAFCNDERVFFLHLDWLEGACICPSSFFFCFFSYFLCLLFFFFFYFSLSVPRYYSSSGLEYTTTRGTCSFHSVSYTERAAFMEIGLIPLSFLFFSFSSLLFSTLLFCLIHNYVLVI